MNGGSLQCNQSLGGCSVEISQGGAAHCSWSSEISSGTEYWAWGGYSGLPDPDNPTGPYLYSPSVSRIFRVILCGDGCINIVG